MFWISAICIKSQLRCLNYIRNVCQFEPGANPKTCPRRPNPPPHARTVTFHSHGPLCRPPLFMSGINLHREVFSLLARTACPQRIPNLMELVRLRRVRLPSLSTLIVRPRSSAIVSGMANGEVRSERALTANRVGIVTSIPPSGFSHSARLPALRLSRFTNFTDGVKLLCPGMKSVRLSGGLSRDHGHQHRVYDPIKVIVSLGFVFWEGPHYGTESTGNWLDVWKSVPKCCIHWAVALS